MNLRDLLRLRAAGAGKVELVEKTVTGNPTAFTTAVAKNLRSLVIPFTYTWEGSGNPTPQNQRPISGVSAITVFHSGADISHPEEVTVSLGDVYYGGSLDAVSGVLTLDRIGFTKRISDYSNKTVFDDIVYYVFERLTDLEVRNNSSQICSIAKYSWNDQTQVIDHFYMYTSPSEVRTRLLLYLLPGADESTEFTAVAPLAEPLVVQLEPAELAALVGENHLWTDTSGENTVVYLDKGDVGS